jgi:hypothetical protein
MRRVVRLVSSNVQLPVLPDARMDTRNEIASLSQAPRCEELRAGTAKMMANCGAYVNNSNSGGELKDKLVASEEPRLLASDSTKTWTGSRDHSNAKMARTYPLFSIF